MSRCPRGTVTSAENVDIRNPVSPATDGAEKNEVSAELRTIAVMRFMRAVYTCPERTRHAIAVGRRAAVEESPPSREAPGILLSSRPQFEDHDLPERRKRWTNASPEESFSRPA